MIYDLIRYFDMFAGIGGFRAGLTRAGGFQCVGHCEIDKYAHAGYCAIHNPGEEFNYKRAQMSTRKGEMSGLLLIKEAVPRDTVDLGRGGADEQIFQRRGIAHTLKTSCIHWPVDEDLKVQYVKAGGAL